MNDTVKSEIYKQLGWMHHVLEKSPNQSGIQNNQHSSHLLAKQCLHKSYQLYPHSNQSLYLLGRCFAAVGDCHQAFAAYRKSLDIAEANADIWCSIG